MLARRRKHYCQPLPLPFLKEGICTNAGLHCGTAACSERCQTMRQRARPAHYCQPLPPPLLKEAIMHHRRPSPRHRRLLRTLPGHAPTCTAALGHPRAAPRALSSTLAAAITERRTMHQHRPSLRHCRMLRTLPDHAPTCTAALGHARAAPRALSSTLAAAITERRTMHQRRPSLRHCRML